MPVLSCTDAGGLSTTATVTIALKETNDFPPQVVPASGSVCKEGTPEASGLVVTAVDQDYPPHAAPFIFEIPDDLPVNWTVSQLNGTKGNSSEVKVSVAPVEPHTTLRLHPAATHAALHPLVVLEAGEYAVPLLVSDSGRPALSSFAHVNITVCLCDSSGDCKSAAGAVLGSSVGISFIALIIVMASIALLLRK